MLDAIFSFWTHALAAVLFTALGLWRLRDAAAGRGEALLVGSLAATAGWAWVVAVDGATGALAQLAETARNLVWLGFLYALTRGQAASAEAAGERRGGARVVFASVAGVGGLQLALGLVPLLGPPSREVLGAIGSTAPVLRIATAAGALVLVHNVFGQAAAEARGRIRLPMLALAAMWVYDLNLHTMAYLFGQWPAAVGAMRGAAAALTVPLFAMAGRDHLRIQLSRAATFQSLSIGAISAYFVVMTITAGAGEATGGDWARGAQVVLLAAMTGVAAVLIPSGWARSWLRVTLAKHFFCHRYDYRAEWLRFTRLMGDAGADAPPLGERLVKAIADIVEVPAGLLLVADEGGRFEPCATWNWPRSGSGAAWESGTEDPVFAAVLASGGRIVDFAALRDGTAAARDRSTPVPATMLADEGVWAGVPLIHENRLAGLVLLGPPAYRRALDWEDFDLLRTAARGAASYLAEARGQEALAQGQRFEEFNRRFAFILHDIKNVVSGLSLVARNAERHAANPDFRADMVATLKSSVEKMNDLLAKLSPTDEARGEALSAVALGPLLAELVAAKRRRHDVRLLGEADAQVVADPARLEQAVTHLIDNAIDASAPDAPVLVKVAHRGKEISIAIVDHGTGMSPEFIRSRLFQPFASTKAGGFGIGAHQARSLVAAMRGALNVDSREGSGTRFTITLPAARAEELAA